MAFWLNALGDTGASGTQSILSTKPDATGPAFRIYWKNGQGFYFKVRRIDQYEDYAKIPKSVYPAPGCCGIWYHYVIHYKAGNTMEIFLNGTAPIRVPSQ